MSPGRFYMHKNSMDIAVKVYDIRTSQEPGLVYALCEWWNLGYSGKPWVIEPIPSWLPLRKDYLSEWHDITDKLYNKRVESGLPA